MVRKSLILSVFLLLGFFSVNSQNEARLLRFPHVQGNLVVFTYANDLYSVPVSGGLAKRLTNDVGFELFAKISPDGKWIAFTGQYDGNTEVYIIPSDGGIPKRLTYTATLGRDELGDRMGPNNIVMAWTPDSKSIVFRSRCKSFNDFRGQLFKISVQGGIPEELPLTDGGFCSFSADANQLAFNWVFREFRTWKYYTGGMADDIRIFNFQTKKVTNLTNNPAQDIFPMWNGDNIYFISDRNRIMNLFSVNVNGGEAKKITDFTDYDIKFPSIGGDKIIFEKGGFLYIYNISNQKLEKLTIQIQSDIISSRSKLIDASGFIHSFDVSPNGERVAFDARGDVFTVPAISGVTRNLTQSSNAHELNVAWSPDGKYIAFLSDKSGEFEVYIQKQDGSESAIQLTNNADTYKYQLIWSPDSKKILWSDKKFRLQYIDIQSKQVVEVAKSQKWEITEYNWAPDSKWITYSMPEIASLSKIYLYNIDSKQKSEVTDGWYESGQPVFSKDGKYLFFVSERDFNPIYSDVEWNHVYKDMSKIYLITLQKSIPNPFALQNNEVGQIPDTSIKVFSGTMKIDLDGIKDRVISLPLKASNYWNLYPVDNKIFYNERLASSDKYNSSFFDIVAKEEKTFGTNLNFVISANGKKILAESSNNYYISDLPMAPLELKKNVDLSGMQVMVDLPMEWKQIYDESWRQMRDFFFAPNMHGVDWKAIHSKYAVLIPYVNHRDDLTYIIGEMIGELNCGHAYVNSGDKQKAHKVILGLLGAELLKDKSGYYKIEKILKGENWTNKLRSPLNEIGVDIKEGDYILAVNGQSVKEVGNINQLLIGKANKQIEITVNSKADFSGAKKTIVTPIADESDLYYFNWVQNNIRKVSEATNNQVGYIHIPDMIVNGLNEFVRYYYPQLSKKALIIDDRGNGGGNVSPMIIERLRREMAFIKIARNQTIGEPHPNGMLVGPKVMLINKYSASDGDIFPYQFKIYKMGKIIGTRSWGGVVGIRGTLPFVDGGDLRKPEFSRFSNDGKDWIMEGIGVEPDIVIENDPYEEYFGKDAQLDKAIEVILEEMKNYPYEIKPVPPYPEKNK